MEFCNGGDLQKVLQDNGPLPETKVIDYLRQFIEGYKELHQKKIMHRDLKLQNLLIHDGILKISDFGFSKLFDKFSHPVRHSIKGTPLTMSPQVFKGDAYTEKCDVWSLGIILYELLYNKLPWTTTEGIGVYFQEIQKKSVSFPQDPPISDAMKQLIKSALRQEEKDRISWADLFRHPIVTGSMSNESSFLNAQNPPYLKCLSLRLNDGDDSKQKLDEKIKYPRDYSSNGNLGGSPNTKILEDRPNFRTEEGLNGGRNRSRTPGGGRATYIYVKRDADKDMPEVPKIFGKSSGMTTRESQSTLLRKEGALIRQQYDQNRKNMSQGTPEEGSQVLTPHGSDKMSVKTAPSGNIGNMDSTQMSLYEHPGNFLGSQFSFPGRLIGPTLMFSEPDPISFKNGSYVSNEPNSAQLYYDRVVEYQGMPTPQVPNRYVIQPTVKNPMNVSAKDAKVFYKNLSIVHAICVHSGESSYLLSSNEALWKKYLLWPRAVEINVMLIIQRLLLTEKYLELYEVLNEAILPADQKQIAVLINTMKTNTQVFRKYLRTFIKDKVEPLEANRGSEFGAISPHILAYVNSIVASEEVRTPKGQGSGTFLAPKELFLEVFEDFIESLVGLVKSEADEMIMLPPGKVAPTTRGPTRQEKLKDVILLGDYLLDDAVYYTKTNELIKCVYMPFLQDLISIAASTKSYIKTMDINLSLIHI
eukprot:TRINITY_DN9738_c0_g1_i2.p1 TRINITY_DN9738_c0_g1~~TRINITY_DN9738_c0_g1_i2.p1  ORF type:complete len:700 (+),score=108.36 TRINITY_DN9738_c0_g1_i2:167-2266(+)